MPIASSFAENDAWLHQVDDAVDVRVARLVMDGHGDGTDAPARPIEHDGVDAVRLLPAHSVARFDTAFT